VCSTLTMLASAQARRLKMITYPKTIAPGQLGILVFENPSPENPISQTKCTADRLIAWVKSDIPILRIEQNGKQVWTSLGSYASIGDSAVASFMAPASLEPGPAVIFLVNERDASVPYAFTVTKEMVTAITSLQGSAIQPLKEFTLVGIGFVSTKLVDQKPAIDELEQNLGYSTMTPQLQWQTLNRRLINDWDKLPEGNFLYIKQADKEWRAFVDECGIAKNGLTLNFQAPPDIKSGPATVTLVLRQHSKEVARTDPFTVNVQ
jgi:hypothetical protein